ncbi:hypothetical protein FRC08_017412 [Ceratobasidium sp. 394]|nr:hypothetical protein FRC08_017412 [Ceratobasidium sp. 394]
MTDNCFTDATTLFSLLINIGPDGAFADPEDVTNHLAPIKYAMHLTMLCWAVKYAKDNQKATSWTEDTCASELDRTRTGPFQTLCDTNTMAYNCASASSKLPEIIWQGEDENRTVSVSGEVMSFSDFKQAVGDYTDFVEGYIKKHLMFGMTDAEAGFDIDENTKIQDRHTNTNPGYSYLTDDRNPFLAMHDTLAGRFAGHPKASKLMERRLNEKGENVWKPRGVDSWLDHYEQATRHLVTLTHLLSGQPARGTEIAMVKLLNDVHRVREIYYMGKGRLAIVLFYNKTGGITGKDRMVAHCVPWRITRLFFLMHGLICPFALQLIHRTLGAQAFRVQEMYAFALRGRHMNGQHVSNELRWFFRQYLDVNIGLRRYRHFAIAVMRKFMLEYIGPMERALAIVDAQAGHGSVVAGKHYAS